MPRPVRKPTLAERRLDLMALIDLNAPVVYLRSTDGLHTGMTVLEGGRRAKRATFICADLARVANDLLGLTDPVARREVVRTVVRLSWRSVGTAYGRERKWFTTEEMADAILAVVGDG